MALGSYLTSAGYHSSRRKLGTPTEVSDFPIVYIKGTMQHGLHISPAVTQGLVIYSNANWAACPDTRISTSGFCAYLGGNLVSWSSKRQHTVSRSSAEAEYRGVANVVSESCWLRQLLHELGHTPQRATLVFCDNVSTSYMASNPVHHQRAMHIEIDLHFVHEKVLWVKSGYCMFSLWANLLMSSLKVSL
jgi:hypothetical protein